MSADDRLSSYDYDLPKELIAQQPPAERSASRLMVVRRETGTVEHRRFRELPELLAHGDLLVLNETKVIPARLQGVRVNTGGRWEGLFLGATEGGHWRLLGQTRGKLLTGEEIALHPSQYATTNHSNDEEYRLTLVEKGPGGVWQARPIDDSDPLTVLQRFGSVPLPPYIERDQPIPSDKSRYQTTYARTPGAVAAPTAGLHFTPEVFHRCRERGIETATVTLHVGIGTFRPIGVEQLEEHQMHSEWCEVPEAAAAAIRRTKEQGGRVAAVGTTTVRTLESVAARHSGEVAPWSGETNLFIRPPYEFQAVDKLVTNFHLPKSSLLVMISAFANRQLILRAYDEAVRERYRFFSYGDAMIIE